MTALSERLKNAWNAFNNRDSTSYFQNGGYSVSYRGSYRPWKSHYTAPSNRSILMVIYNQIAVDCSQINIRHVRLDEDGNYKSIINDSLNRILTLEANIDQTGREFIRDAVISMLEEGVIALVPIETDVDPMKTDSYKVYESRVGKIVEWYPREILVEVYNDLTGNRERILVDKRCTPIIENPFYSIMNEPNSTLQQLKAVLAHISTTNGINSSGKLDLIVQLPYPVRNESREKQAEQRRKSIEDQLNGATYGIAYIDGAEKIVQLNRSVENNLWEQRNDLIKELFNEMGLSSGIFDGSADEATLLNYYNRTIEPIITAISEGIERKWISRTAQSQNQAIRYFKDPFKLVPVAQLAEIADKFTRNMITTSNEFRSIIGFKPADDPEANKLMNHNLNQPTEVEEKTIEISKSEERRNEDE